VPDEYRFTTFNLSRVYPNPFKGSVKIEFDVPTIMNVNQHAVQIGIYDMKGSLIKTIANGIYRAGHYSVSWNCKDDHGGLGSNMYIVRMKADNFDKRQEIISLK